MAKEGEHTEYESTYHAHTSLSIRKVFNHRRHICNDHAQGFKRLSSSGTLGRFMPGHMLEKNHVGRNDAWSIHCCWAFLLQNHRQSTKIRRRKPCAVLASPPQAQFEAPFLY